MRSTVLARELIAAILKPTAERRPLIALALALEEALNCDFAPPGDEREPDEATARFALLEIE